MWILRGFVCQSNEFDVVVRAFVGFGVLDELLEDVRDVFEHLIDHFVGFASDGANQRMVTLCPCVEASYNSECD
jgi:hypothetical protein